jgi:hypothetical protein
MGCVSGQEIEIALEECKEKGGIARMSGTTYKVTCEDGTVIGFENRILNKR